MVSVVTGASGFIGGHLAAELAASARRVRALTRRARHEATRRDSEPAMVEWVTIDYADSRALQRAVSDAVVIYHAAGVTRAANAETLQSANVVLTRQMLDAVTPVGPS